MNTISDFPSPFRVMQFARMGKEVRWRTEAMRSYSAPSLIWFIRGQGRITVNGIAAGYGANNCVFLPAGTMHGFEMSRDASGTLILFPQGCEKDLSLPDVATHLRLSESVQHNELRDLVDNLEREIEKDTDRARRATMCHAGLLSVWLDRQITASKAEINAASSSSKLVSAFTSLVELDFHSPKTVRDYAADLGVTATHLSRVCNKTCGRPASAILQDRIHYEARRLLSETHLPIKDIAKSLGFTSAAYFTRAFQKQTGSTPSTFRKSG